MSHWQRRNIEYVCCFCGRCQSMRQTCLSRQNTKHFAKWQQAESNTICPGKTVWLIFCLKGKPYRKCAQRCRKHILQTFVSVLGFIYLTVAHSTTIPQRTAIQIDKTPNFIPHLYEYLHHNWSWVCFAEKFNAGICLCAKEWLSDANCLSLQLFTHRSRTTHPFNFVCSFIHALVFPPVYPLHQTFFHLCIGLSFHLFLHCNVFKVSQVGICAETDSSSPEQDWKQLK